MHGLLDKNFVTDLRADGTFNEASFSREYESI
nr:MAG TPA: Terminase large subunit [Caudoviricetes sp.]